MNSPFLEVFKIEIQISRIGLCVLFFIKFLFLNFRAKKGGVFTKMLLTSKIKQKL
jgi:hypothetical protein